MTLNVFFFGLICHIKDDAAGPHEKSFAAVVKAQQHTPMIWGFSSNDVLTSKPLTKDVRFTNLEVAPAAMDDLFEELVPNLKHDALTLGELKDDVKRATNRENVHSYVHYVRGSELYASQRYAQPVKYDDIPGLRCIAKITRLEIPSVEPIHFHEFGGITLSPTRPILLMNASRQTGGSAHNKEYKHLLESGGEVAGADDAVDFPCDEHIETIPDWVVAVIEAWSANEKLPPDGHPGLIVTLHVECANTQWP